MTVLMHDAVANLVPAAAEAYKAGRLYDLLYADDTLILGTNAQDIGQFAAVIERMGANYGMSLHWGKTQALPILSTDRILQPDGTPMTEVSAMKYLGAVMDGHGRSDSEISRKLGCAKGDFRELSKLWSHSAVTTKDKLKYFHSMVVAKLLYGLSSMWLVTAQRRRLDGFYARCLRRILRIPCAYVSRISNAIVFARAGVRPFSDQLVGRQLQLLGKVAHSPDESRERRDTFIPGTLQPQIGRYVRRVGRPRQDWTNQLLRIGCDRMGRETFGNMLADTSIGAQQSWIQEVKRVFVRCVA